MRIAGIVLLLGVTSMSAQTSDVAAARKVFEGNLDAIRQKDRDKYLSYYFHSESLLRTRCDPTRKPQRRQDRLRRHRGAMPRARARRRHRRPRHVDRAGTDRRARALLADRVGGRAAGRD